MNGHHEIVARRKTSNQFEVTAHQFGGQKSLGKNSTWKDFSGPLIRNLNRVDINQANNRLPVHKYVLLVKITNDILGRVSNVYNSGEVPASLEPVSPREPF